MQTSHTCQEKDEEGLLNNDYICLTQRVKMFVKRKFKLIENILRRFWNTDSHCPTKNAHIKCSKPVLLL